jgi:hypothetical protein
VGRSSAAYLAAQDVQTQPLRFENEEGVERTWKDLEDTFKKLI